MKNFLKKLTIGSLVYYSLGLGYIPSAYSQVKMWTSTFITNLRTDYKVCERDQLLARDNGADKRYMWAIKCGHIDSRVVKVFTHEWDYIEDKIIKLPKGSLHYPTFAIYDSNKEYKSQSDYPLWTPDYDSCDISSEYGEVVWLSICEEK